MEEGCLDTSLSVSTAPVHSTSADEDRGPRDSKHLSVHAIGPEEIKEKNRTGTWLSPLQQPEATAGAVACEKKAPSDPRHRKFIGSLAECLDEIVEENKRTFGEPLEESFKAAGLNPRVAPERHDVNPEAFVRSARNCPLTIRDAIELSGVYTSLVVAENGVPRAAALLYTWIEKGFIRQGRVVHHHEFLVQVRHHTRLESFHDVHRPVYCVNLKTAGSELLDLRVMAIIKSEMPFLEAAARQFGKDRDHFEGLPVVDHEGRVLIDERIVRRAAWEYSQYQRSIDPGQLYENEELLPERVKYAHFIVLRAHMPELNFVCC